MFTHFPHHRNNHHQLFSPQVLDLHFPESIESEFISVYDGSLRDFDFWVSEKMAGGKIFNGGGGSGSDGSVSPLLLRNQASEPLNNLLISGSSSSSSPSFLGPRSMVNFKDGGRRSGSNRLMFCPFDDKENGEDEMDEFLHQPEKKRRLTADQVQFLEKSFEQENKLEPDRKTQLAKEIGLQPRQVAIWFQNRRARWKTKQLEKDFEVLQSNYDTLKAEYENLLQEKDKLKAEVLLLTEKLLLKEKDKGILEFGEPPLMERSVSKEYEEDSNAMILSCKLEEASSVKSDILNSDKSDISNEEENSLEKTLFPPYIFPKLEDEDYSDPPTSSCSFAFPVEDNAFWSWSY